MRCGGDPFSVWGSSSSKKKRRRAGTEVLTATAAEARRLSAAAAAAARSPRRPAAAAGAHDIRAAPSSSSSSPQRQREEEEEEQKQQQHKQQQRESSSGSDVWQQQQQQQGFFCSSCSSLRANLHETAADMEPEEAAAAAAGDVCGRQAAAQAAGGEGGGDGGRGGADAVAAAGRDSRGKAAAGGGGGSTGRSCGEGERRKRRSSNSSSSRAAAVTEKGGAGGGGLCRTAAAADAAAAATAATAAAEGSDADEWVYEDDFGDDYEEADLEVCMRDAAAAADSSSTSEDEEEEEEESEAEEEEEEKDGAEEAAAEDVVTAAAEGKAAAVAGEPPCEAAAAASPVAAADAGTKRRSKEKKKKKTRDAAAAAAGHEALASKIPQMRKEEEKKNVKPKKRVWRPGVDTLAEGEVLQCDMSAYDVLHRMTLDWPCLSFDILPNEEMQQRGQRGVRCCSSRPPFHCYVVSGTQAESSSKNRIFTMKWSNLQRTTKDASDSSSSEEEEEDDEEKKSSSSEDEDEDENVNDEDARLDFRLLSHRGTVNRIRSCPQMKRLIATWSDTGDVEVWDIAQQLQRLDDPGAPGPPPSPHQLPKFTHRSRSGAEGFAIDWNPLHTGKILTGDVRGAVHLWLPVEAGWSVSCIAEAARSSNSSSRRKKRNSKSDNNSSSKNGISNSNNSSSSNSSSSNNSNSSSNSSNSNNSNSSNSNSNSSNSNSNSSELHFVGVSEGATVEEVQWKVTGDGAGDVFATASNDGGIRIYDCRDGGTEQPSLALLEAHPCDVNALRWSPLHGDLLLSGDEEGCVKVWDKRYGATPLALMCWHKKPITSVDWHPTDEAVFASAALDDTVAFWDLSIEADDNQLFSNAEEGNDIDVEGGNQKLPDQLLFVHMGQEHISEIKFHPQIPGALISTACDGFNFFKPCNL